MNSMADDALGEPGEEMLDAFRDPNDARGPAVIIWDDACRICDVHRQQIVDNAVAQAVQAAYEHAASIAQDHQCPPGRHSCGGDIAAALRVRPTKPTDVLAEAHAMSEPHRNIRERVRR